MDIFKSEESILSSHSTNKKNNYVLKVAKLDVTNKVLKIQLYYMLFGQSSLMIIKT